MKYLRGINEAKSDISDSVKELVEECFVEMEHKTYYDNEFISGITYDLILVVLPLPDNMFISSLGLSGDIDKMVNMLKFNLDFTQDIVTNCVEKVKIQLPEVKYDISYDFGGLCIKLYLNPI